MLETLRKIAQTYGSEEKGNASRSLARRGIYIDIAGIEWEEKLLRRFSEEKRKFLFGFDPLTIKK